MKKFLERVRDFAASCGYMSLYVLGRSAGLGASGPDLLDLIDAKASPRRLWMHILQQMRPGNVWPGILCGFVITLVLSWIF